MGETKKQRSSFQRPKKPFDKDRIIKEKKILKEYGLRRKTELWKTISRLRNFRRRARELLAKPDEKKQKELFERLNKLGLKVDRLDDVLELKPDHLLSRRLQTIVFKKGIAKTQKQARQLIVHRHILIKGRKVWYPGFIVLAEEEDKIELEPKVKESMLKIHGCKAT